MHKNLYRRPSCKSGDTSQGLTTPRCDYLRSYKKHTSSVARDQCGLRRTRVRPFILPVVARMRYSKIIIAKLLLSCAAALTTGLNRTTLGRIGFALGNRQISGDCKSQADYELDLEALARESAGRIVRTYAAAECGTAESADK